MARRRARRNQSLVLPLVFGAALLAAIAVIRVQTDELTPEVRGDAEMRFCSKLQDAQCQPGVAPIDISFSTRNPVFLDLYDYEASNQVEVRVQEIEVNLNLRADEVFTEDENVFLYRDTDEDGFHSAADVALADGLLRGKRIVFEDINLNVSVKADGQLGRSAMRLFMVRQSHGFADQTIVEDGESIRVQLFKNLAVKARDLTANNAKIPVAEAVADRSLFDRVGLRTLTKAEVLDQNPSLSSGLGADDVVLGPGRIELTSDVIVAGGLNLEVVAGTELLLGPDVSFISYSPVTMAGTEDAPIWIKPLGEEPFGVFGVIGSMDEAAPTTLDYVNISGGSQTEVNGAFLSGMMSIYRSPFVQVSNSEFAGAMADDGLNIKYGKVELQNNRFLANSADAFDGDFVTGEVRDNVFESNGNDSIDVSGSTLLVKDNTIRNSGDKGVSIGEGSDVTVLNNLITGSFIGVQAKDASTAIIYNNAILDSEEVGVNAYVKKAFFGEPNVELFDNAILGAAPTISGLVAPTAEAANWVAGDPNDWEAARTWLPALLERR